MVPRKPFPEQEPGVIDDEPDDLISLRRLQRIEKANARRLRGAAEPSELARLLSVELWIHRELNDLSQAQLAERLGVKQPQVARLESGFVTPSFETLARISDRIGLDFVVEVTAGRVTARATRRENRPA